MQAAGGYGVHTMDWAEGREGNVNMKHALVHWCTCTGAPAHLLPALQGCLLLEQAARVCGRKERWEVMTCCGHLCSRWK